MVGVAVGGSAMVCTGYTPRLNTQLEREEGWEQAAEAAGLIKNAVVRMEHKGAGGGGRAQRRSICRTRQV